MTTATTKAIIDYAENWFEKHAGKTVDNRGFKRFLATDAAREIEDRDDAIRLYEAATGKHATTTYGLEYGSRAYCDERKTFMNYVERYICATICTVPTSASDLIHDTDSRGVCRRLRNFLKDAASAGVIRSMEVSTCGKVAIRLYFV